MAEAGHVSDRVGDLAAHSFSLFECCCCRSSKHDPVQLNCLHYYCRSCFDSSGGSRQVSMSTVTCPACSEVTEIGGTVLTSNFLCTYKRASAIRAEIVWCNTCEKKAKEETAEFWCVVCAEALCAACYVRHNKFISGHRMFELEHARSLPLSQLTRPVECNLHMRPMEAHCFACCFPKCRECLDSCSADSHDWHLLSDEATHKHVLSMTNKVSEAAKRLGSQLPGILQKCRAIASRLQADRRNGHNMLVKHRRRLHDSTLWAFQESAGEVGCGLQSTRYEHPNVLARGAPRGCAANMEKLSVSGFRSLQLFGIRNMLKTVAACCGFSGRSFISKLLQRCEESGSISISGSVSLTSDVVLSACLGATVRRQAALRAPLLFRDTTVSFQTTVDCYHMAATRDGHVLLAARKHGLLVYSDRGQQLSSWRPERRSDGKDDRVCCVAALSDGGAAVGVLYAHLVVLLKLSEAGDTWQEDRRVSMLQSPPGRLAAHGDLLAAAVWRDDEQRQRCVAGPVLKLLRLSSGQVLYTQSRDYDIAEVALTALCVVTTSRRPVQLSGGGATTYVLDAFSHSGQFLWRYETTSDMEYVLGLCVSADVWSRLYVTVRRRDPSSGRVLAIGGADGGDCHEVMSSETHGPLLPGFLSLARGRQRTVLAVLSYDSVTKQARSLSLYEATS